MDKMANEANFCISSNPDKIPLNVTKFLTTNNEEDIVPVNRNNIKNLTTLTAINNNFHLDNFMRAYHAHAKDNLIVGFDVENFEGSDFDKMGFSAPHRTDPTYLAWFAQLPAHYREYSAHYGIHIFYQLRRQNLTNDAFLMLTNRTEYKVKTIVNNKKLEFELMLNNHWLSITQNTFGNFIPLEQDAPAEIYQLINNEAKRWNAQQTETLNIQNIENHASPLAKKLIDLFEPQKYDELKELSIDDFNNDDSYYEYNIALKIGGSLYYRLQHPRAFDLLHLEQTPTDNDIIWAISLILETIVPKRAKMLEKRSNLPWLTYVSKTAFEWIKTHQS